MDITALFFAGAGTGLLAGGTTCAAVQLGLLTGAVTGARPARRSTGGSDARAVTTFLTAKLLSHAVLGALLGLAGGAVQPGPRVRGVLLTVAALSLAVFALDLLGFRPARRLLPHARHDETSGDGVAGREAEQGRTCREDGGDAHGCRAPVARVGAGSRGGGWRRAAGLGAATVLVPCGLTLSAELLAVTSRSAVGGAVVMSGFVLGTAPLFGVVGVTVGRVLAVVRRRVTVLLAVGLLAAAGWTLLSGLRLGGWLPEGGRTATAADSARFVRTDASGTQVVTVWALDRGYRPARVTARAGVRTVLVLRTDGTRGHTRAFTIPQRGEDVILPERGATRIDLGVPGAGRMRFVCASGHYPGAITFR